MIENFLKNLKDLIKDDENDENKNEKIIEEDYFEYPINDWDKIDNEPYRTAKAIGITSWYILCIKQIINFFFFFFFLIFIIK